MTYKMEQGDKEALLAWSHHQEGVVQDSESGGAASGRRTSLELLRTTSGGSRREGTHLPGLPESPHLALALPTSLFPSQARGQCQQELPNRPFEYQPETQQTGGPQGKHSQPTCQWRDEEESSRP